MKASVLRSVSLLALVGAALSASAQNLATLTLNPTSYTVVRPTSGSTLLNVTGTLTSTSSTVFSLTSTNFSGLPLIPQTFPITAIQNALAATGTYTGTLITYRFDSTTPLGSGSADVFFNFPGFASNAVRHTVTLIDPSSVPSPAAMGPFALGALATLRKRRRRA